MDEAAANIIGKLGFPIFVATFLLLRVDKTLREILVLLGELMVAVKVLAQLEGEDEDEDEEDLETEEGADSGPEDPEKDEGAGGTKEEEDG